MLYLVAEMVCFCLWTWQAFIFWFEPVMVIVMAVQLGVSYVDNETRDIIQKYFNFITITPLALVCLVSSLHIV